MPAVIVRLTAAPSRPRPTRRGLRSHGGVSPPRQSTARGALSAQRAFLWPSLRATAAPWGLASSLQTQRQGAALTREQHVAINLVLPELLHDSGPFLPALRLGPSLHFLHLPVAHRRGLVCRLGGGGFGRQRGGSLGSGLRLDLHRRGRRSGGHLRKRSITQINPGSAEIRRRHWRLTMAGAGEVMPPGSSMPCCLRRCRTTAPMFL